MTFFTLRSTSHAPQLRPNRGSPPPALQTCCRSRPAHFEEGRSCSYFRAKKKKKKSRTYRSVIITLTIISHMLWFLSQKLGSEIRKTWDMGSSHLLGSPWSNGGSQKEVSSAGANAE